MKEEKLSVILSQLTDIVKKSSLLMSSKFEVIKKEGITNIVTSNDNAVQDFLKSHLTEILPESGFLCEEDVNCDVKNYTWIIDPIDGTTNYSRGIDYCAISVALKVGNTISLSAVYSPYRDEMFTALRGYGAYLNGKRIEASSRTFESSLLCCSWCAYHKENIEMCSNIINDIYLQCNDIRRFGAAALELCYLAMGRCELFFEFELYPWDYAAASLILNEAGGIILNLKGNDPEYTGTTGIIAANNANNIKRLYEIVAKHIK